MLYTNLTKPNHILSPKEKFRNKLLQQALENRVIPVVVAGNMRDGGSGLRKLTVGGWSTHATQ